MPFSTVVRFCSSCKRYPHLASLLLLVLLNLWGRQLWSDRAQRPFGIRNELLVTSKWSMTIFPHPSMLTPWMKAVIKQYRKTSDISENLQGVSVTSNAPQSFFLPFLHILSTKLQQLRFFTLARGLHGFCTAFSTTSDLAPVSNIGIFPTCELKLSWERNGVLFWRSSWHAFSQCKHLICGTRWQLGCFR